jgi:hypothetical protein
VRLFRSADPLDPVVQLSRKTCAGSIRDARYAALDAFLKWVDFRDSLAGQEMSR